MLVVGTDEEDNDGVMTKDECVSLSSSLSDLKINDGTGISQ